MGCASGWPSCHCVAACCRNSLRKELNWVWPRRSRATYRTCQMCVAHKPDGPLERGPLQDGNPGVDSCHPEHRCRRRDAARHQLPSRLVALKSNCIDRAAESIRALEFTSLLELEGGCDGNRKRIWIVDIHEVSGIRHHGYLDRIRGKGAFREVGQGPLADQICTRAREYLEGRAKRWRPVCNKGRGAAVHR